MTIRVSIAVALALTLPIAEAPLQAQSPAVSTAAASAIDSEAATAIRQSADAFVEAFNRGDASAIAALWTPDGEYIDEAGRVFTGRKAIAAEYAGFFAEHPGATMQVKIASLRSPSPAIVIEQGRATLDPEPSGAGGVNYTAIHVNFDGQWLMASVRDTRVETPSSNVALTSLEWLVGSWSAEGPAATAESTCRWIANKSFLQRSFRVRAGDDISTSGEQIIGWNPLVGALQSWTFTADGGVAVGAWTQTDAGWVVESVGATADGTPTYSVTKLTPLDADAFAWQAVARSAGDATLPDTEEVIMKRVADKN
jgi:uncharacterized protein (TIGR02246 family)